jgi:hypothetical protein
MKSSSKTDVNYVESIAYDMSTKKLKFSISPLQNKKEFIMLRFKQEKCVMMPHEYKLLVFEYLGEIFKGATFDSETILNDEVM